MAKKIPKKPVKKKPAPKKPVPKKPVKKKPVPKLVKLPPGFKSVGQDEAKERIEEILSDAARQLAKKSLGSKVYVHINRDDSIDGELKVPGQRGLSTKDLFFAIEEAMTSRSQIGIWISAGVRFSFQNDDDPYHRYKGTSQIQTNYRRYTPGKKALVLLTARVIAERVEKRSRRKVEHAFVRLHWNPEGKQPKRR